MRAVGSRTGTIRIGPFIGAQMPQPAASACASGRSRPGNWAISGPRKDSACMGRANRRATAAARAERHATELAARLGAALRDARLRLGLRQADAARRAGISQATWSSLEVDRDARYTLATWDRAAHALGTVLNVYLPHTSAAAQPRDAV